MKRTAQGTRTFYLSALAGIWTVAFCSYWVQYDGLLGAADGLLPMDAFLAKERRRLGFSNKSGAGAMEGALGLWRKKPHLGWFAEPLGVPVDTLHNLAAMVGMALGSLAAFRVCQHGFIFLVLWLLYLGLYGSGQTFFSFQWDILLLETGFASILYAPWSLSSFPLHISLPFFSSASSPPRRSPAPPPAPMAVWPLRFLLFKLMLMSGVVKVQAHCPTWLRLTALEYHFATQCIPTPLAWWAHQLPPIVLRAGVATTLLAELPAPFLLLAPSVSVRRVGAQLQLLLQLLIALTGNYNFFNLLTAALCLPALAPDVDVDLDKGAKIKSSGVVARIAPPASSSSPSSSLLSLASVASLCLAAHHMFELVGFGVGDDEGGDSLDGSGGDRRGEGGGVGGGVALGLPPHEVSQWVVWAVPKAVACTLAATALSGVRYAASQVMLDEEEDEENEENGGNRGNCSGGVDGGGCGNGRGGRGGDNGRGDGGVGIFPARRRRRFLWGVLKRAGRCLHAVLVTGAAVALVCLMAVPLVQLDMGAFQPQIPMGVARLWHHAAPFSVSSGYGLFRSMTGVGELPKGFDKAAQAAAAAANHDNNRNSSSRFSGDDVDWRWLSPGPPSVVARPEVVLEGLRRSRRRSHHALEGLVKEERNSSEEGEWEWVEEWVEIPFRYKPSDVWGKLRWVAPHQPRLDWQMWFAALGQYQGEPWLVHLAAKLLIGAKKTPPSTSERKGGESCAKSADGGADVCAGGVAGGGVGAGGGGPGVSWGGCPCVLSLLAADDVNNDDVNKDDACGGGDDGYDDGYQARRTKFPFNACTGPPLAVRASLHHYDFTRVDSAWAKEQPSSTSGSSHPHASSSSSSFSSSSSSSLSSPGVRESFQHPHVPLQAVLPMAWLKSATALPFSLLALPSSWSSLSSSSDSPSSAVPPQSSPTPPPSPPTAVPVWTRKYVGPYLPELRLNDPSLAAFLAHHGLPTLTTGGGKGKGQGQGGCRRPSLALDDDPDVAWCNARSSSSSSSGGVGVGSTAAVLALSREQCGALASLVSKARLLQHRLSASQWRGAVAAWVFVWGLVAAAAGTGNNASGDTRSRSSNSRSSNSSSRSSSSSGDLRGVGAGERKDGSRPLVGAQTKHATSAAGSDTGALRQQQRARVELSYED